ncbi:MAG: bifunctional adenosylcobinamide kinase/adenosylcobinamide-phosphate guanylyltransferase [Pseudomonadota bacterium]
MPTLTLVLGGARSGKSALAERLAEGSGLRPLYVATAEAGDGEMAARIALHRARRGERWQTVEAPLDLAKALNEVDRGQVVLIDCLTLWLSNLMHAGDPVEPAVDDLLAAAAEPSRPVVCVSNEVGLGIVPENALARRFRDAQGALNQRVAAAAGLVVFVAAGLPLVLKGTLPGDPA